MPKTDLAEVRDNVRTAVRDNVKPAASAALDTVRAQASSAGETLAARASVALDNAEKQSRAARKQARKRAQELAEQAKKSARKSAKKSAKAARKHADKAGKKAEKKARELNAAILEKAGRKPRRSRGRRVAVLGGLALGGVLVARVLRSKQSGPVDDPYAPPPTELPGEATDTGAAGDNPPQSY
jgi:hypothetical protein